MLDKVITDWNKNRNNSPEDASTDESIIDFEHKSPPKDVFPNDKLKSSIKKALMDKIGEVLKKLEISEDRIVSYYVFGSITGLYYNEYTDIDFQVMVKYNSETKWEEDLREMKVIIPEGYIYHESAGNHPLNFYIHMYDGKDFPATIDGMYDVKNDKWIKKQETKINVVDRSIFNVAEGWMRKIEADISELKRDLIDLKFLKVNKKEIGNLVLKEEDLSGYIKAKETEIIYDLENVSMTFKAIKDLRANNQIDMAKEYKDFKGEIKITPKNVHMFSGVIVWKLFAMQDFVPLGGSITKMYRQFTDGEIKKEKLLDDLEKKFIPKNLWGHG